MHKRPVVVVTAQFVEAVEERIDREFEARRNPRQEPPTQPELLRLAEGADALLITPANQLDEDFFEKLSPSVKVIATCTVGYDHIDLAAASRKQVAIANTPGVLTDATADIAILLLLGASRRAYEAQQFLRSGHWKGVNMTDFLGCQLTGKILGIYGLGRIGQAVAARARAFGMQIHYCNRTELPPEQALGATFHEKVEDLLRVSSFLSLHAPATPETHHFLNTETLALLPRGAIVVNAARGNLVDDDALIAALKRGQIFAAGLDVYDGEPRVNAGYFDLQNVFLLPHLGSATVETRVAMGMLAIDNILAVLEGKVAPSLVQG
jgi:lactate dehydrogenase-like 2-hydroxyacid dehydrogenase